MKTLARMAFEPVNVNMFLFRSIDSGEQDRSQAKDSEIRPAAETLRNPEAGSWYAGLTPPAIHQQR
jgi:hypothetical protein